jgi:hypothetical protein
MEGEDSSELPVNIGPFLLKSLSSDSIVEGRKYCCPLLRRFRCYSSFYTMAACLFNTLDSELTAMKAQRPIPSFPQLHRQPRRRTCELFVSCNLLLAHHLARVLVF